MSKRKDWEKGHRIYWYRGEKRQSLPSVSRGGESYAEQRKEGETNSKRGENLAARCERKGSIIVVGEEKTSFFFLSQEAEGKRTKRSASPHLKGRQQESQVKGRVAKKAKEQSSCCLGKGFSSSPHEILLQKSSCYGERGKVLLLVEKGD